GSARTRRTCRGDSRASTRRWPGCGLRAAGPAEDRRRRGAARPGAPPPEARRRWGPRTSGGAWLFFVQQPPRLALRVLEVPDAAVELELVHRPGDSPDDRSGREPHLEKVPAHEDRRGWAALDAEGAHLADEPLLRLGGEVAG